MQRAGARYVPNWLWNFLHTLRGRIIQVYFYLFIFHYYRVIRTTYEKKYNRAGGPEKNHDDQSSPPSVGSLQPAQTVRLTATTVARLHTRIANAGQPPQWQWRDLPRFPSYLAHWRTFTTIYMCYVVIKNTIPHQIGFVLDLLDLEKPSHCYLLGKFKIYYRIDALSALFFAIFHISWRIFVAYFYKDHPLFVSAWYFLILDEHDIKLYHKLVANENNFLDQQDNSLRVRSLCGPATRRSVNPDPIPTAIDGRTQLMQDVMGLRMDRVNKTIYKLRPNRTLKASKNFYAYLAHVTVVGWLVFLPIVIGVAIAVFLTLFNHQTYLWDYPNCDSILERLNREHRLGDWWHHWARHQYIALVFDFVENVVLWLESGLVCYSYVTYCITMNFDLLVYWDHVHCKITKLLKQARQGDAATIPIINLGQSGDWDYQIYELQMTIRDFMDQLRQADTVITCIISTSLTIWFSLFAAFTYGTITQGHGRFPVELSLVLIFVFIVTSLVWLMLLILQRNCLKSYPVICSLMALDHSGRKRHFVEILDYFVRQRTCYTIYGTYPLTVTNYLTIVGYTFSCFFLLSSRNYR